jgi:hypothetical protein
MSGTTWRSQLRPASWRGIPFRFKAHNSEYGRRLVEFEYPLNDIGDLQDMGERMVRFTIVGYVLGDDYEDQLRQLINASRAYDTPGTLVHPYRGSLQVRCAGMRVTETNDEGRIGRFEFSFIQQPAQPGGPRVDTAAGVLSRIARVVTALRGAMAIGMLIAHDPTFLRNLALGMVSNFVSGAIGNLLGLPGGVVLGLLGEFQAIALQIDNPSGLSDAVTGSFGGYATAIVSANPTDTPQAALDAATAAATGATPGGITTAAGAAPGTVAPYNAVALTSPTGVITIATLPTGDPTFGLTPYASGWGVEYPIPIATTPLQLAQASTVGVLVALVRGGATLAIAQIYASTTWGSAQASAAAQVSLLALIDTQALTASAAGYDDLCETWQQLYAAVVTDMTTRAQHLPTLGAYAVSDSLPWLALAQRLYQDGTRADELVLLNDVAHPLFMPATGQALAT